MVQKDSNKPTQKKRATKAISFVCNKIIAAALVSILAGATVFYFENTITQNQARQTDAAATRAMIARELTTFTDELAIDLLNMSKAIEAGDSDLIQTAYYSEKDTIQKLIIKRDLNEKAFSPYSSDIKTMQNLINELSALIGEAQQAGGVLEGEDMTTFIRIHENLLDTCIVFANKCSEASYVPLD